MGNETSKVEGADDALDPATRPRETTPPIGTGRYADNNDDGLTRDYSGSRASLPSSMRVEDPGGTQLHMLRDGLPVHMEDRGHALLASDPGYHDDLPMLSSPNRRRPPAPPPATEPLPFCMSITEDGMPRGDDLPKTKKSKKSRHSGSSQVQVDDHLDFPSGLTKAERKALRKARKAALKAAKNAEGSPDVANAQDVSILRRAEPSAAALPENAASPVETQSPPPIGLHVNDADIVDAAHTLEPTESRLVAMAGIVTSHMEQHRPESSRKRKATEASEKEGCRKKSRKHDVDVTATYENEQHIDLESKMVDHDMPNALPPQPPKEVYYNELNSDIAASMDISALSNGQVQALVAGSGPEPEDVQSDLLIDPSIASPEQPPEKTEHPSTGSGLSPSAKRQKNQITYRRRKSIRDRVTTKEESCAAEDAGEDAQDAVQPINPEAQQTSQGEKLDAVAGGDTAPPTSRSGTRSTGRRKSKPSYLDRHPQEAASDIEELSSTEAASPPKRNRAAAASKAKRKTTVTDHVSKKTQTAGKWITGVFSAEENDRIRQAVEEFRSEEGMSQFEVNQLIHQDPTRNRTARHTSLWEKVHSALPQRQPRAINYRTRKLFHNFNGRQVFTEEEDAELRRLVELMGPKWTEIGAIINRSPLDIRDRWRNYTVCGDKKKTDVWSHDEEARLVEVVVEAIAMIKESRGQRGRNGIDTGAERDISWEHISKNMDRTRSAKQCREKWQMLRENRRVSDDGTYLNCGDMIASVLEKTRRDLRKMTPQDKLHLIEAVRKADVEKDSNIEWARLGTKGFRKAWDRNTLRIMWARLRRTVQGQETMPTNAVADELIRQYQKDNVLTELRDSDVDMDAEASLIEITKSARRMYRTPGEKLGKTKFEGSAADGPSPTPTRKTRSKKKQEEKSLNPTDAEVATAFDASVDGADASQTAAAPKKTSKRKSSGRSRGASGANAQDNTEETTAAATKTSKSAEFIRAGDSDSEAEQDHSSPEVPASPERLDQRQVYENSSERVMDSQGFGGDGSQESGVDDQTETESVDLAQPARPQHAPGAGGAKDGNAVGYGSHPPGAARAGSAVSDASSLAADKFRKRKKAKASQVGLSRTRTPRTPFSAARRAATTSLSVYDDIESANGESSQAAPEDADGDLEMMTMGTQDEAAHQRQMEQAEEDVLGQHEQQHLDGRLGLQEQREHEEGEEEEEEDEQDSQDEEDSEAERQRRLEQESDEDSDMEDIPAALPQSGTVA